MVTGLQSLLRELHLQWKADFLFFFFKISSVAKRYQNSVGHIAANFAINIANFHKAFF